MQNTSSQATRDLLWIANSPSLLAGDKGGYCPLPDSRPLSPAGIDDDHLKEFLDQHPSRQVGRYFETLVSYWLRHIRRLEIVSESQTIFDGNRSIGEIDFIFYDEQRRLTHWEVAVKFYLHLSNADLATCPFIGPNARDTLDRKIQKLLQHQLPLSRKLFPEVEIRHPFLKGRLFYHDAETGKRNHDKQISADHLAEAWCRHSELEQRIQTPTQQSGLPQSGLPQSEFQEHQPVRYRLLKKPHWLADETAFEDDDTLWTSETLLSKARIHFTASTQSVLVARLVHDGSHYKETGRFFVVPETWPNLPPRKTLSAQTNSDR